MRKAVLVLAAVTLAGCSKKGDVPAVDTAAMAPAPVPVAEAPKAMTLADMAGTWTVVATKEGTDSTLLTYELTADADSMWSIKFADRAAPVPLRVLSVAGDSIVVATEPYTSALRKGTKVQTTTVLRLQDGKVWGTSTARYSVKTADSVLRITTVGTRK